MVERKAPKIGFMSIFGNLGETRSLVEIAKKYKELGGEAVFIGYGSRYEKLARDIGCKTIIIKANTTEKEYKKLKSIKYRYHYKKTTPEKAFFDFLDEKSRNIDEEIKTIKNEKLELLVSGAVATSNISARVVKIPLVFVISGVASPPYFESNRATFPDNFENFFIRLIPKSIKNRFINWYILRSRWRIKKFNKIARKYKVPTLKRFLDLFAGDLTLMVDDINFLNIEPTTKFPTENYVGPIISDVLFKNQEENIENEIETFLKKPGRSILLSLGSSGRIRLFLDILKALNKTNYNVIAVYGGVFTFIDESEYEFPKFDDNILLKKYVPSMKKINEMIDLAIIHGGLGTVYTAAYSGKPVIGFPMHSEQQHNLDNLVQHGVAIRLSNKYFKEIKLLAAINEIFNNYDRYLRKAQLLKSKLPEPKGAENAAKRIFDITTHNI